MYDIEFIDSKEIKEIEDETIIKLLLSQPNVEEYIDKADLKKVEQEKEEIKKELEQLKKETKTTKKAK